MIILIFNGIISGACNSFILILEGKFFKTIFLLSRKHLFAFTKCNSRDVTRNSNLIKNSRNIQVN